MIRGRDVDEAISLLEFTPRRSAEILRKILRSAIANAEDVGSVDVDKLYIKRLTVDQGPTLKRYRPRAQGRAYRINKKTSHIELVVDEPPVEGDANGDGQVDFTDLVLVVLNFGCAAPETCEGDVDFDGDVDFQDVTLVLSNLCSGIDCDDGDPCTIDTCIFGFCINFPDPACGF